MSFMLECLSDLDSNLEKLIGLNLCIAKGNPKDVFDALFTHYNVQLLT